MRLNVMSDGANLAGLNHFSFLCGQFNDCSAEKQNLNLKQKQNKTKKNWLHFNSHGCQCTKDRTTVCLTFNLLAEVRLDWIQKH